MKLKIGDLPNPETCVKLSMISFNSPNKNLDVYRMLSAIKPFHEFFKTERTKLIERYGVKDSDGGFNIVGEENVKSLKNGLNSILELEINDHIPTPDITLEDFSSDLCGYPEDKSLWLNANDINAILTFCEKQKINE